MLLPGNDPRSLHYQCSVIPLYYKSNGVSYRYRSGTTAFTEQGADHYTKDTIDWQGVRESNSLTMGQSQVSAPIDLPPIIYKFFKISLSLV